MAKKIALFNHKGGVSKTTTTFNLGWMLASKGKRVVLVDADPQCNLTGMVLGYRGPDEFEKFYQRENKGNLKDGVAPAFESRPKLIEAVECVQVDGQEGLFLLPGHIRLSEYEVMLGIAQELSGATRTLQNLPGSIAFLLEKTAEKFHADYMLIDMNPSLSSINQNLLMTSNFFIVPTPPDYFSMMAIDSLTTVLPRWHAWAEKAHTLSFFKEAIYPLPKVTPKFLGTIVQNYRPRGGVPAAGFQKWIDEINRTVSSALVPVLSDIGMVLHNRAYKDEGIEDTFCLATIPDFNTLIAKSQEAQTPVFALTPEQIGHTGPVLENTIKSRNRLKHIFSELADKVIGLTSNESSDYQFRKNIARVHNLGTIHKALEAQTTGAIDLSDILRAELVMAVSALDHYIHEIVRKGMLEVYRGNRPETPAFLRFDISLESVRLGIAAPTSDHWLDNEIRIRHSWRSFQQADNIADAVRLISGVKLWQEVANHLRMTSQDVKTQLNLIVDRRNKIAHEADIDPTLPSRRWPINETLVDDAVNFIEQVAETIYKILT